MVSFLDSITSGFSKILAPTPEGSAIGIDIGSSSAKIVQLRPSRGSAVLETYGEIALGPFGGEPIGKAVKLGPEKLAEALQMLMKEANVTAHIGGISIPFASSLISVLDFPMVDKNALTTMIPIEARKYIPVPISEVTLDWFVIPKDDTDVSAFDRVTKGPSTTKGPQKQQILLVAIENHALNDFKQVTQTVGLTTEFYEIEIFSTIRSSLGRSTAPVLVADVGASTTKLYVVERGVVRLTHLVTVGGQQMSETLARSLGWEFEKAERIKRECGLDGSTAFSLDENEKIKAALLSTLDRIFSEVNRVLLNYGQRYNKNVSHVVLTGGGASLPGLAQQAKASLSADVEIADPFSRAEAPAFLGSVLRGIGPGFAVAMGLVLHKLKDA